VGFTAKALALIHKMSGGIPRLINLICDRSLLAAFSVQTERVTPELVQHAAKSLDIAPPFGRRSPWSKLRASALSAAAMVLLASAMAVGATAFLYQRFAGEIVHANGLFEPIAGRWLSKSPPDRRLPPDTALTVLVESYPDAAKSEPAIRELTQWLEASGHRVYYERVDLGRAGQWWRVLAGTYSEQEYETASWDAARLKAAAPILQARVITAVTSGTHQ
jgi:hypothetical protein